MKDLNIIFETITGSMSRGTNIEGSDEDRKGIFLPSKESFYGLLNYEETLVYNEPEDREFHVLKKFLNLATFKANPTVLEMLFTEDRFITVRNPVIDEILNNREIFLSKKCYYSFSGYAKDQLMRIKNAKLGVTQEEKQEHIDYVVNRVLRDVGDRYSLFENGKNKVELSEVLYLEEAKDNYNLTLDLDVKNGDIKELFGMLNELRNVLKTYNKVTGRNRKSSEERLWKHAMQLTVLLKMGIEVLNGEGLKVYRNDDRKELISIRNGELSWDEFYKYINSLNNDLDNSLANTKLPDSVDNVLVDKLHRDCLMDFYD